MEDVVPTYIRLPADLKRMIDEAAKANRRSKNREVLDRLYGSFSPSKSDLSAYDAGDLIGELLRRFEPGEIMIRIGKD